MKFIDFFPPDRLGQPRKKLSPEPTIHPTCRVTQCQLGRWTELMEHTHMAESSLGDFSYTAGFNSIIYSQIGKFTNIASMVRINPGNHPTEKVCQHHMMYRRHQYDFGPADDAGFFEWRRSHPCHIGHDVWIGHGASIMPGVTIGHGAIVGTGSVVTHDVPDYMIVVGVPARPLRPRFPSHIAQALLRIQWWDWDESLLRERFDDLHDPNHFIRTYDPQI